MERVMQIVQQLENTSSSNEKINIIRQNKDNETFTKVLYYTYNTDLQFGFSEKKLKIDLAKHLNTTPTNSKNWVTIFDMLDELAQSNINDNLRLCVYNYLNNVWSSYKELLIRILTKDLRIGCNVKNINKAIPNLIPTFGVMLAESYFKQKEGFLKDKEFTITQKLDGNRLLITKQNDTIKCFTRQGKIVDGLVEIERDMASLPNDYAYDGELIADNVDNLPSDELFRVTMKESRKKGTKKGLIFNCFDIIPLEDFNKGYCPIPYTDRKTLLSNMLKDKNLPNIINVPILYQGKDEEQIIDLITWAKSMSMEGVMVNVSDAPYECKRSKNILKGKVFQEADLRIIGFQEGEGNFKDTLGALVVNYKGNKVAVGSGYTWEERDEFWNKRENLIGKIVTVQYFEESKNSKTGLVSLRFPVFKQIRDDKTEESYN